MQGDVGRGEGAEYAENETDFSASMLLGAKIDHNDATTYWPA